MQPRPHGDGGGGEGGEISFLGARCLRQAEANLREFYLGRSCRGLVVCDTKDADKITLILFIIFESTFLSPAVLPASAGPAAEAGDPVFELIRAKLIQILGLRARPCSRLRPAVRRRPGTPYLN